MKIDQSGSSGNPVAVVGDVNAPINSPTTNIKAEKVVDIKGDFNGTLNM
ncbi:MAG: hypothetical protein LBD02_04185 [Christensenellaceae bacterium]|nr:hypothetical protein [Christensenellaceae bacterium]